MDLPTHRNSQVSSRLLTMPDDIFLRILECVMRPSVGSLQNHVTACVKVDCTTAQNVRANVRLMNMISGTFRRAVWRAHQALVCVRVSSDSALPESPFDMDNKLANLQNTIAIDVNGWNATSEMIQYLSFLVDNTPQLIRFAIRGLVRNYSNQLALKNLLTKILSKSSNKMALVLDIDIDSYTLLADFTDIVGAMFIAPEHMFPLTPTPHWSALRFLGVSFSHWELDAPEQLLEALLISSLPRLEVLVIDYDTSPDVFRIEELLKKTAPTVKELTVHVQGWGTTQARIPNSDVLERFRCYYYDALSILTGTYQKLTEITLDGFNYNTPAAEHGTIGLHGTKLLDDLIIVLHQKLCAPNLNRLKLLHAYGLVVLKPNVDVFEWTILAFWGTNLPLSNISFLDFFDQPILPHSLPRNLIRWRPDGYDYFTQT